jgi:uncharacterized protein (DUF924 family)/uncharacterized protein YciI
MGKAMHHLLLYDLAPDYLERRSSFRDEHLALAWQAHERGELVLAGAVSDPADLAVLLWQGDSPAAAEAFAAADPYVRNGLVKRWRVRAWNTVAGAQATNPVRPADFREVLAFWFGELDAEGQADAAHRQRWFRKDPAFDRTVGETFGELHAAVARGERNHWLATARGRLALILVLDQFSRNMFRDTPPSFAQDARAQALTLEGIALGQDRSLALAERSFFYMPLMHAEDAEIQDRGVAAFAGWRDELSGPARAVAEDMLGYAVRHRDLIRRFGRFPHRNQILGRDSTAEEEAFLKEPGSSF